MMVGNKRKEQSMQLGRRLIRLALMLALASVSISHMPAALTIGSHVDRIIHYDGTKTCLRCHQEEAKQMHSSVHYQWQGSTRDIVGAQSPLGGKWGGFNDFCIYPNINWLSKLTNVYGQDVDGGCARCHAGLGLKPTATATQEQLENIDCLVCHSDEYKRTAANVNGVWKLVPDTANMSVTLLQAAQNVKIPSSGACLNCHTKSGGGNNNKRGDLEEAHRSATRDFDVHLASRANGGAGLTCVNCHGAENHRIAGRGIDLKPRDTTAVLNCTKCHPAAPHGNSKLDRHTARLNCTVCHIPYYAKVAPTDMERDYSQPAEIVAATGLYEPHMLKEGQVEPEYVFWNGKSKFYEFNQPVAPGPNGRQLMAGPLGSVTEPGSKIYAIKRHYGYQPMDPVTEKLLPLKMGIYFTTGNLPLAIEEGAKAVGWVYNGYTFQATERVMGLFHEVAPSEDALQCSQCHAGGTRMDFAALGYTPKTTYNNRPLCASCHRDMSNYWTGTERFYKIHEKHVTDKKFDCSVCHSFSKAS